jgi:outer membrane protein
MKAPFLAFVAILAVSTPAVAQDEDDYRVRVGLGGRIQPAFVGSEDMRVRPIVNFDLARGTNPFSFEAPDDVFGFRLFSKGGFAIGPTANLQAKRKNSDLDLPVGKVPTTLEVGGFAEYQPSEKVRLRADLRKGLGGHDGLVGAIGADRIWRDGDRYVISLGPRILLADKSFQRAFFGVDSEASLASGLPPYSPKGGIYALAATSGMSHQLNSRWGFFGYARYEHLVGDAAKSPIVRALGSRNQLSGGLGLSYTFNVKR